MDAAFDFTNQQSFNQSFRLLKPGGTLVTYAVFPPSQKIEKKTTGNFLAFGADFGLMRLELAVWNRFPNGKTAQFFGSPDSKKELPGRYQPDLYELFTPFRVIEFIFVFSQNSAVWVSCYLQLLHQCSFYAFIVVE